MDITGISVDDPIYGSQSATQSQLGKDSFMKLLVQQLKNQDPLEPAKNEQMRAQLAQFSSLEEMQELNENIVGLAVLQQSNALMAQLTDSSALIGKSVQYLDPETNEQVWGTVDSVKISDGIAVLQIGGKDVPLANVSQVGQPPDPGAGGGGEGDGDGDGEGDGEGAGS
jgi:flagellar basal-body rod modification protein FlgD